MCISSSSIKHCEHVLHAGLVCLQDSASMFEPQPAFIPPASPTDSTFEPQPALTPPAASPTGGFLNLLDVWSGFLGQSELEVGAGFIVGIKSCSPQPVLLCLRLLAATIFRRTLNEFIHTLHTYLLPPFHLENAGIRLTGSSIDGEGRLEVFSYFQWGTVCDNGFGEREAKVACEQLGFSRDGATLTRGDSYYSDNDLPTVMDGVSCLGTETTLQSCTFMRDHDCLPYQAVGE